MSGPKEESVQSESGVRYLSLAGLRVHHLHIQNGRGYSATCGVCSEGLEIPFEEVEVSSGVGRPAVDKGDGADEEGDSTSSSSSWMDEFGKALRS